MATTKKGFEYVKTLNDQDIIEQARIIAEASKKIEEIKEQQKQIKTLQQTIIEHSKYIQEGAISGWSHGVFEWHKPVHGVVTVSFDEERRMYGYTPFPTFVRDMTEEELKDHCELEIPFEQVGSNEETNDASVEANKSLLEEIIETNNEEIPEIYSKVDEEDDQEISEIFGVTEQKDEEPVISEEDPVPDYTIAECESTKYPWNILEGSGKDAVIFERFRTKEEAETFLTLFNENKIPENSPGAKWIMEKGLGGWKVKKCEYENGRLLKSTFHTIVVCYFEAKQMCENINSGTLPSEMKIVSENDRYQIVENPDGSLKTILKTTTEESIPDEEVR